MFDKISNKYDFINDIMSFKTHLKIKSKCVELLCIKPENNILDLCCGTGDFAFLINKSQPKSHIIGVDFSEKMLETARKKFKRIDFMQADATKLPFNNNIRP